MNLVWNFRRLLTNLTIAGGIRLPLNAPRQREGTAGGQMLRSRADAGLCLSSAGGDVEAPVDEWCIANNNMCTPMIRRPLTLVLVS